MVGSAILPRPRLEIFGALLLFLFGITPAYSCALGFSFHFEKLPQDLPVLAPGEDPVGRFMDKKFGKTGWQVSRGQLKFKEITIIENSNSIPLTFGSAAASLAAKIASIELYQINATKVIEFAKSAAKQKAEVSAMFPVQVPIKSDIRIGPAKPNLMAAKIRLSATFRLNTDPSAPPALPLVSVRVKALANSRNFQAFAVFYPVEKGHLPVMAKTKILPIHGCKTSYFVKGAWPKNLRASYSYN